MTRVPCIDYAAHNRRVQDRARRIDLDGLKAPCLGNHMAGDPACRHCRAVALHPDPDEAIRYARRHRARRELEQLGEP